MVSITYAKRDITIGLLGKAKGKKEGKIKLLRKKISNTQISKYKENKSRQMMIVQSMQLFGFI